MCFSIVAAGALGSSSARLDLEIVFLILQASRVLVKASCFDPRDWFEEQTVVVANSNLGRRRVMRETTASAAGVVRTNDPLDASVSAVMVVKRRRGMENHDGAR